MSRPAPKSSDWIDASFYLPRPDMLPVEIELQDGTTERRDKSEGDWSRVKRWRRIVK